jgi:RNA polymerase sigma factor (sigma-70 family)
LDELFVLFQIKREPTMTIADYNLAVDAWADALYRYVLKNLGSAMPAQDVVQDCYEKLWIHRENLDSEKVKSWLFTTAHHTMIDGIRKTKKETFPGTGKIPERALEHGYSDLQEILVQAVERLPQIQKSVVLLRDYEGYSYREIGDITGLSEAQVKVYIYRSRIFLKNYIGTIDAVL